MNYVHLQCIEHIHSRGQTQRSRFSTSLSWYTLGYTVSRLLLTAQQTSTNQRGHYVLALKIRRQKRDLSLPLRWYPLVEPFCIE